MSLKGLTEKEIAKELNLSQSTVSRAITSVTTSHDYQLAITSIGMFVEDMRRAADFWKLQNREIELVKNTIMALKEETDSKGQPVIKSDRAIELLLKCMDMQSDRIGRVVEMARQGEVALALREVRRTMSDAEAQRFVNLKHVIIDEANGKLEAKVQQEQEEGEEDIEDGQP